MGDDASAREDSWTTEELAARSKAGDREAQARFFARVYPDARRVAHWLIPRRANHSVEATELLNEAAGRFLSSERGIRANDRLHLVSLLRRKMQWLLKDRRRRRTALKRGGENLVRVALDPDELATPFDNWKDEQRLALLYGLEELSEVETRQAQVVKLRVIDELDWSEVAAALNIGRATACLDFERAQNWLVRNVGRRSNERHGREEG